MKLTSDFLEELYGSFGINIIKQTEILRYVHLSSSETLKVLAFSLFPSKASDEILKGIRQTLRGGGSIGITLRDNNINYSKKEIACGMAQISKELQEKFKQENNLCICKVFEIIVQIDNAEYVFCTTVEVYSDDFQQFLVRKENTDCKFKIIINESLEHFIRENGVNPIA